MVKIQVRCDVEAVPATISALFKKFLQVDFVFNASFDEKMEGRFVEIVAGCDVEAVRATTNWRFEKFMTLKIQTDELERIEATSADIRALQAAARQALLN